MYSLVYKKLYIEHIDEINRWYENDSNSNYVEAITPEYIEYVNENNLYYSWVIFEYRKMIASISYEISNREVYLSIIVNPRYRKLGYGSKIVKDVLNRKDVKENDRVSIGVHYSNRTSIEFFTKLGFIILSKEDNAGFINMVYNL